MNKFILATIMLFALGCTSNETNEGKKGLSTENKIFEKDELELNNGKKWNLDDITKKNIAPIKSLLKDTAVADFRKLASGLQQQTDKLVSECKMKGKDHEALHHWLEGWLADLKGLKDGEDQQKPTMHCKTI
jgi:hypothetical protein